VALAVTTSADGQSHFQFAVPAYSMTVLELTPNGGGQGGGLNLSQLRDRYGFRYTGNYFQSYGGLNAKWFQDRTGNWYALFSDGSLKSWTSVNGQDSFTAVAAPDASVYADPQLLFEAPLTLSEQALIQLGQLEQAHGFHFGGSYWQSYLGLNEKWFQD